MASLTERYVHAVTAALPEARRSGVAEGLEAAVALKVRALRASDPTLDRTAAEYAALHALGDPAARIPRPAATRHLVIRPRTFAVVLAVVVAISIVATVIAGIAGGLHGVRDWDAMAWLVTRATFRNFGVLVVIWFAIELVGQVRQVRGRAPSADPGWQPDSLPEVP